VFGFPGGFGRFGGAGGAGGASVGRGFGSDWQTDGGGGWGSGGPTPTQVTITTNASTVFHVGGVSNPSISSLAANDRFRALFTGSPTSPIATITSTPALSVEAASAPKQHQLYAFVGTVKSTDTTAGTVTVTVAAALPSSLVASGTDATFTLGRSTLVLGGSSSSSSSGSGSGSSNSSHSGFGGFGGFGGFSSGGIGNIAVGDMLAGGLIGNAGMTAAQVEAAPLMLVLDLPMASGSSSGSTTTAAAKAAALKRAELLLGGTASKKHHSRTRHHSKHPTKKH
jgi:hypothetical protein